MTPRAIGNIIKQKLKKGGIKTLRDERKFRINPSALITAVTVAQPLMDVFSYLLSEADIGNSLSSALRLLVLAVTAAAGLSYARSKHPFAVLFAVLSALSVLHFAFAAIYGTPTAADATNLIRIYSLPVTAVSFYAMLDADETAIDSLFRAITVAFFAIVFVMIASTLTGTDPHTYPGKKLGVIGWFSNSNSQSAVLSAAVPFAVAYATEKKRAAVPFVAVIGAFALYFFGTRLAYGAVFGIFTAFFVATVMMRREEKTQSSPLIFLVIIILFALLLPFSPMSKKQLIVSENAAAKAADIATIHSVGGAEAVYYHCFEEMVNRFGFDAVYDAYDKSLDPTVLTDARLEKITYLRLLMRERPLCGFFGINLSDMTSNGKNFDCENDFHGIYFLCGGAGLLLLILFIVVHFLPLALDIFKHRSELTPAVTASVVSFLCSVVHAVFTAGVLRRPNASFYLAVSLATMLYFHKKINERRKNNACDA